MKQQRAGSAAPKAGDQELADLLPVTVFEIDTEGRLTFTNRTGLAAFGYSQDDLDRGLSAFQMLAPTEQERARKNIAAILHGEDLTPQEYVALRKDGSTFPVIIHSSPILEGDRRVGIRGVILDITERRRAEARLRDSETKYRHLFEHLNDAAFVADAETGIILDTNKRAEALLDRTRDEIVGMHQRELHPAGEATRYRRMFAEHVREGHAIDFGAEVVRRDGTTVPVAISAGSISIRGRRVMLGLFRDITERKQVEELIQHRAHHDALTGLPNRALFADRLEAMLGEASREGHMVAVLFADLDRLKTVNDTFGHARGDQVLRQAAQRLRGSLRPGDTVARIGGDEFAAALGGIGRPRDAAAVGWRILHALRAPFAVDDHQVFVTGSAGIALYPSDAKDADGLLRKADAAMYRAKEQGRNRLQFHTAGLAGEARRRLALEGALRQALTGEEFCLHFQPQVEVDTGSVTGVEALLRWRHPRRGILPPADFLETTKEIGLIDAIGEWVLRNACAQAKAWEREGLSDPPLRIAVNLSAREFHREGLADIVRACLADVGLDPSFLELEICESAVTRHIDSSIAIMQELKQLGVSLALDDFGLGHSSLIDLRRLPADVLKIDRTFIRDVTTDESIGSIVEAIIALAHSLGLEVVAEGVETEDQLSFLRERGCRVVQGYLYSAVRSPEAIAVLLADWRRAGWPLLNASQAAREV
jgi:diguanylate cyclase (GGDEF)-like protein/PAS domain S-box-containing protein